MGGADTPGLLDIAGLRPGLRVTPHAIVRKVRRLPLAGTVLVRSGDRVTADQIVARTELPGKVYPQNVTGQLSILPDEVPGAMRKQAGQPVKKDELLAETRSLFGLFRSELRSPIDGVVESISRVTGQVILRESPIPVEIDAYVAGVVVEELAGEGVVVETEGAYVQGIFGLGGETRGPLTVLARAPDEILDEARIGPALAGQIIVAGARLTLPAFHRCVTVGVRGVVCGGFAYQDLRELLGADIGVAITGHESLGTTLVLTEGFGTIAMARATYELLAASHGCAASMNGATQIRAGVIRPEIVISRPRATTPDEARPPRGLQVGAPVRCVRAPYFGQLGTIAALPSELRRMPSETLVRVVEVRLAVGEQVALPRANVELIETG